MENSGNITLGLSNSAANTSPVKYQVKIGDGAWQDCTSNIVISADCTATVYTFKATSAAGVVSDETTFTVKRDTTAPENVSVSYGTDKFKEFLNTLTFGLFFKDTVTVTMTATDATSGVKEFTYTLNDGEKTANATNGSATFTIETQYKGNISGVKAIDNAGKESTAMDTEHFAVDKQNPAAPTVNTNGYTSGNWTKDAVTFTLSGATATSGIAKYQYSTDGGKNWIDMVAKDKTDATATEPLNVTKAELTVSANTNGVDYTFRAVSNAGNEGAASAAVTVKIDTAAPTIAASGNTADYKVSDTLTVTPTAGDSGITKVEISKDNGAFGAISNNNGYTYLVEANGTYTVKVTNGAGVSATDSIAYDKIDAAKPAIVLDSHGYTTDSWENSGNITLSLSNSAANTSPVKYQVKIGDGAWQDYTSDIVISADCTATVYTFKATSAAGGVSDETTFTVKRDTVAPDGDIKFGINSVKKFINQISFGLFFKEMVDVTITGTDAISGVLKTEYYTSDTVLDGNKAETYTVVATDKAGNETIYTVTMKPIADLSVSIDSLSVENGTSGDKAAVELVKTAVAAVDIANATKAEKDLLTALAEKCDGLLQKIADTAAEIQRITDAVNAYQADEVKSTDKAAIEQLKADIKMLTDSENLTEDEITALGTVDTTADSLLKRIADADAAANLDSFDPVKDIDKENVKLSNKEALDKAKIDLEKALADFSGNYTEAETKSIHDTLVPLTGALAAIENAQKVIDGITALPVPGAVTVNDADAVRAAKKAYDALTDHEKSLVETSSLSKLNKDCTALANLFLKDDLTGTAVEAIEGTIFDPNTELTVVPIDPTGVQKSNLRIVAKDSEIMSLYDISLLLDGAKIQPDGKVKITLTLTEEQLKAFNDFQIVYMDDSDKATILSSVMNGSKISFETDHFSHYGIIGVPVKTGTPPTGDNSNMPLWVALLFVSGGVLTLTVKRGKKRSQ